MGAEYTSLELKAKCMRCKRGEVTIRLEIDDLTRKGAHLAIISALDEEGWEIVDTDDAEGLLCDNCRVEIKEEAYDRGRCTMRAPIFDFAVQMLRDYTRYER